MLFSGVKVKINSSDRVKVSMFTRHSEIKSDMQCHIMWENESRQRKAVLHLI